MKNMIFRFIIILLFIVMCSANDYLCETESIFRQKAQGTFFSTWEEVENNKIKHAYGRSLLAFSNNDTELYYKQSLFDYNNLNNYTVISRIDGELNQQWLVVYKIGLDIQESLITDDDMEFIYTVFNVGTIENNHDIIVKLDKSNGEIVSSKRLTKDKEQRLSHLQYDKNSKTFSILETNNTFNSYRVCFMNETIDTDFANCYYSENLTSTYHSYKFYSILVLFPIYKTEKNQTVFINLQNNATFSLERDNMMNIMIKMVDTQVQNEYFIVDREEFESILVYKVNFTESFSVQMMKQIYLDVGDLSDINIVYNTKRNLTYIFVMYKDFPKTLMIEIDQENKIRNYVIKVYTSISSYGTSFDRWIYFIGSQDLPFAFTNIFRIYDKAIEQSDLIFNISLQVKNAERMKEKLGYNIQHGVIIFQDGEKMRNISDCTVHKNRSFDSIALELEYQYFDIDGYNNLHNEVKIYNSSCIEKDEKIYSEPKFLHNPKQIRFSLSHNNSVHKFDISYPISLRLTTWYELILITKFKQKEYKTPMTIQISKCNVTNCAYCDGNISNKNCTRCISGYVPISHNNAKDKCKSVYSVVFAKLLYNLLKAISIATTVCFVILLILREKLLMHLVIYIENKLLFIFIAKLYYQVIPSELNFIYTNDIFLEEFTVYFPFYPIPNLLFYLPKLYGTYLSYYVYFYDGQLINLAIVLSGIVVLSILILVVLLFVNCCKHNKIVKMIIDNLILTNIWYALSTSLLFPLNYWVIFEFLLFVFAETFGKLPEYYFYSGRAFLDASKSMYLLFLSLLIYLSMKFIPEFLNQIFRGETCYGYFGANFMDNTKRNVRSRLFLFIWFIKIVLTQTIAFVNISRNFYFIDFLYHFYGISFYYFNSVPICYLIFCINLFGWFLVITLIRPFKSKSVNFALIIDLLVQSFLVIAFALKYKINESNDGYFDNFSSTLVILAATLPGTFLAIFSKGIWIMKSYIIRVFPYVKRFLITTYQFFINISKFFSCKKRNRKRKNTTKSKDNQTRQMNRQQPSSSHSPINKTIIEQ